MLEKLNKEISMNRDILNEYLEESESTEELAKKRLIVKDNAFWQKVSAGLIMTGLSVGLLALFKARSSGSPVEINQKIETPIKLEKYSTRLSSFIEDVPIKLVVRVRIPHKSNPSVSVGLGFFTPEKFSKAYDRIGILPSAMIPTTPVISKVFKGSPNPPQTQPSSEVPGYAASTESSRQRASEPNPPYPVIDNANSNPGALSRAADKVKLFGIHPSLLRGSLAQFCVYAKLYKFGMVIINF